MQSATKVTQRSASTPTGAPVTTLAFTGDIASTSKDAIMAAFHSLDTAVTRVLLDFRGTEYINSSGIAIIIQLLLEAHKSGTRTVGIFGLTPHFTKVLTMVGVAKYATLSPDEPTALAAFT